MFGDVSPELGGLFLFALATVMLVFRTDLICYRRLNLLNPILLFAGLYLLYNALFLLDQNMRRQEEARDFLATVLVGMTGITAATLVSGIASARSTTRRSPRVDRRRLVVFSLLLTVISSACLLAMFILNLGVGGLFTADSFDRASATRGILTGFNFLLPIGIGFSLPFLGYYRAPLRVLVAFSYMAILLVLFYVSGSRGQILHAFLLSTLVYHYCVKQISSKNLVLIFLALLLAMAVTGSVRGRMGQDSQGLAEAVSKDSILQQMGFYNLEPYKAGIRSMELIEDGPPGGRYLHGKSLFYFIPYLAPRVLSFWDRPEMLEQWYVWNYDPETAYRGGGWGFSPLVDAYFNVGNLGVFLYFTFFTLLLWRVYVRALNGDQFSRSRFWLCLVSTTLIEIHRASIAAYIKNYICVFALAGFLLLTFVTDDRHNGRAGVGNETA